MELRPYQAQAVDAILGEWDAGRDRTLLVLPTGTGKTVVFATVAARMVQRGLRGLVLAHRGELLSQASDKIRAVTGMACAVEKAEQTSLGTFNFITVGSVQTLSRENRLSRFDPDRFGFIVVDEAHHALSDSYQAVLAHFPGAKVLGVTATPDRGDRRNLGQYFDSLAYEYGMAQAVRDGYLCPIEAQTIPLKLDISQVGMSNGDYAAGQLGTALDPYLESIADEMVAAGCKDRRTVVFLPLVATAEKFAAICNERGLRAAEVDGNSTDRREVISAFEDGGYDVLCNSMLLTEGWDCPSVDCIVVLRPTRVRSLYAQMVGRGTRLAEGKDHLLLLDFLWHTENHELCHPAHLVCEDAAVAARATELLAASGCPEDIEEVAEKASEDVVAQREEALAEQLRSMRSRRRKLVDPLQFEMSIAAEDLTGYVPSFAWEMAPVTDAQRETLERRGIFPDGIECAGKASMIIDRLNKRRDEGLSTPRQIRQLENRGFMHVGQWSFDDASAMISRIAALGWKRNPPGVDAASYIPPSLADRRAS